MNILIEAQGLQHYFYRTHFYKTHFYKTFKDFFKRTRYDLIKKLYCIDNGIKLLEIKYNEIDDIESILKKNNIIT